MKQRTIKDPATPKQKKYFNDLVSQIERIDPENLNIGECGMLIRIMEDQKKVAKKKTGKSKNSVKSVEAPEAKKIIKDDKAYFDKFRRFIEEKKAEIKTKCDEEFDSVCSMYGSKDEAKSFFGAYYVARWNGRIEVCDALLKTLDERKATDTQKFIEELAWKAIEFEKTDDPTEIHRAQMETAREIETKLNLMWCENDDHYCNHNYKGEEIEPIKAFPEYENEVVADEQAETPKKGHHGKPKGYSGHQVYCLWLPPEAMGDAKILAKIKDCKVSDIVDAALTEYLADEERAKRVAKYKKFLSEFSEEIKAVKI